jgi:hypothetical protein
MQKQLYINRSYFFFIISLIALSFCLLLVIAVNATQDIKGYKTNGPAREMRYELPALCVQAGQDTRWWRCTFSPECSAMANLNQQQRKTLVAQYNQALFGISMGPASVRQTSTLKPGLVAMIMNYYYVPYTASYVEISIGPTNTSDWANILNKKNNVGKYPLVVSDDLFYLSPAMLFQSLGHEIVHMIQYERRYSMNILLIDSAITAFRELEASTWESGTKTLDYFKKGSNFYDCLKEDEKNAAASMLRCREWGVRKAIQDIREKEQVRSGPMKTLEKWLGEDEWTRKHWLPSNPEWKTYEPGPKPQNCPI